MSVFVLLFCISVTKQMVENVFAVPYDHKYPLCTFVSKSNKPLRFKILYFYIEVIVRSSICGTLTSNKRVWMGHKNERI